MRGQRSRTVKMTLCLLALIWGATQAGGAKAPSCSDRQFGLGRLGPRPVEPALGLLFSDGRPARWDPLVSIRGVGYWSCDAACEALGAQLIWNPEQLRGELQIDSMHCRFIVGGEVIHSDDQGWQLRAPILYADNRLLLPLDFVELAADSLVPTLFRFASDSLILIQRPRGAVIELPTIEQVGRRTYVRWHLPEQRSARMRADGASGLIVDIDGVAVDPAGSVPPTPRSGACLWAVRPYADGTAFCLNLSADVRAWRFRWRTEHNMLELTLSENDGDRAYRSYHRWEPPLQARGIPPDAPIALRVPGTDEIEAAEDYLVENAICLAQECGRTLAQMLEQAGHEVILLEDGDETDWVAMANRNRARLGISVRPGQVGDQLLPGIRIVTYDNLPGHLPLEELETEPSPRSGSRDDDSSAASRALMRPWRTVSAAHSLLNHQFGRTIASGLGRAFPADAIHHLLWPTVALEGLDLPGAVIYVGALDPSQPFGLTDEDGSHRLAGALAAAVLEFLERPARSSLED